MDAVEDERGLLKVRVQTVFEGILDQLVAEFSRALVGVVENIKRNPVRFHTTASAEPRPAASKAEGGGEENLCGYLGMAGRIERGQVTAHVKLGQRQPGLRRPVFQ